MRVRFWGTRGSIATPAGYRPFWRQHRVCGSDDERGRLLHI